MTLARFRYHSTRFEEVSYIMYEQREVVEEERSSHLCSLWSDTTSKARIEWSTKNETSGICDLVGFRALIILFNDFSRHHAIMIVPYQILVELPDSFVRSS